MMMYNEQIAGIDLIKYDEINNEIEPEVEAQVDQEKESFYDFITNKHDKLVEEYTLLSTTDQFKEDKIRANNYETLIKIGFNSVNIAGDVSVIEEVKEVTEFMEENNRYSKYQNSKFVSSSIVKGLFESKIITAPKKIKEYPEPIKDESIVKITDFRFNSLDYRYMENIFGLGTDDTNTIKEVEETIGAHNVLFCSILTNYKEQHIVLQPVIGGFLIITTL